ncbi:type III-B CRISPR-associated protein Cas10/Cmr2 [Clostridium botulinum]|nr:type III-B CRISPR-associated protein Cas10/Cmr2 [Clostridium botulinum]NFD32103.1 type III-B CRISPR-associated protein Cas10/Cmr2 [Clostridium botulinum]NFD58010.1 type III-B CRISPR-associated protein Cas10/Cmr2 [Clostridium botulinum]NFD99970.1 type III-B CRISPR-associated protein Cas10/Cmr2 [Clostridium botulinum]
MQQRIILFSIGSIQNFIINSRKVSDLFNSSRILSKLISNGMEFIKIKGNGELLLPQLLDKNEGLPNYFIMKYESNKHLGKELEGYIRLNYIDMFMNGSIKTSLEKYKEQIEKQLDSSLDIYWVEYDLEESFDLNDSYKYRQVYYEVYKYFEAVKNIKKFNNICEEGKKCSICGSRNAIVVNSNKKKEPLGIQKIYKYQDFAENSLFKLVEILKNEDINLSLDEIKKIKRTAEENKLESKDIDIKLKENEMLCGVCLLKRIYEGEKIPSLAQITLSSWIENEKKYGKYNEYKEVIDKLNKKDSSFDDYECMYEENWDKVLKNLEIDNKDELKKELIEKLSNKKLPKYYCMYRMDIDNLGKWMSGKYNTSDKNLYEYQTDLSQRIYKFFDKLNMNYFQKNSKSTLVYAGRDDLLALIPVDEIFKLEQNVSTYFEEEVQDGEYKDVTYSKGIFVAHYKTPLGEITRVSKEELEKVKEKFREKVNDFDKEKNATVISIMTEGYSNRNVYFKNDLNGEQTVEFIFEELVNYFNKDESTYFHDQLQSEFWNLDRNIDKGYQRDILLNMLGVEQKRLMKRSILKDSITEEKIDEVNKKLINFLEVNSSKELKIDFENYFNLFHIIRSLKQNMEVK